MPFIKQNTRPAPVRLLFILIALCISMPIAVGEGVDTIIGEWKGKDDNNITLEFKSENDFQYNLGSKPKKLWQETIDEGFGNYGSPSNNIENHAGRGVWEIGEWKVGGNRCNLMIYSETTNCCVKFKFLGDNLILRKVYTNNINSKICLSRVLIKAK